MEIAIVFTSITGNTEQLSTNIFEYVKQRCESVCLFPIESFPLDQLAEFNGIMIGTYTWGEGIIPTEMEEIYSTIKTVGTKKLTTAVFGTGDRFYSNYCGAVDQFRDRLAIHTNLAVTLKVELAPQEKDAVRCERFVELFLQRINNG